MKKNLLFLTFIYLSTALHAQKNSLSIGLGRSFHTFQDMFSSDLSIRYERQVANRWNIGLEVHGTRRSFRGGPITDRLPRHDMVVEPNQSIWGGGPNSGWFRYGFNQYETHSGELLYISNDLNVGYDLVKKKRHQLTLGLGASLTYADYRMGIGWSPGNFENNPFIDPNVKFILVTNYYNRFLDIGPNGFLRYQFHFNDRTAVAARLSHRQLSYSSAHYTTAEAMFTVKF